MGMAGLANCLRLFRSRELVVHLNWLRVSILVSLQPATPVGCSDWMEVVLCGAELPSCFSPMRSKLRRADRSVFCHHLQRLPC